MKKAIKTNYSIKLANQILNELKDNIEKVFHQSFWQHKVTMEDKIKYIKEIAEQKANLFRICSEQLPKEIYNYTVSNDFIEYEIDEKELVKPEELIIPLNT